MTALDVHLDHFAYRLMRDAMNEGTALYWQRRADQLDAARPRPGDYTGRATDEQIKATDKRLAEAAEACRLRAKTCIGAPRD